jgi:hypothetical protein
VLDNRYGENILICDKDRHFKQAKVVIALGPKGNGSRKMISDYIFVADMLPGQ